MFEFVNMFTKHMMHFSTGKWYEIKAQCLLFAGNCLKTNETEQTHYTSRSCDIIHARRIKDKKGLLKRLTYKSL